MGRRIRSAAAYGWAGAGAPGWAQGLVKQVQDAVQWRSSGRGGAMALQPQPWLPMAH